MRINDVHSNRQLRPTCLTAGMQELHILNWLCFLHNYFSPTLSKRLDCTSAGPGVLQKRMSFTMQIVLYTRRELRFACNSEIVKLMLVWRSITVKRSRMLANRWESPRRSASVHIQFLLLSYTLTFYFSGLFFISRSSPWRNSNYRGLLTCSGYPNFAMHMMLSFLIEPAIFGIFFRYYTFIRLLYLGIFRCL